MTSLFLVSDIGGATVVPSILLKRLCPCIGNDTYAFQVVKLWLLASLMGNRKAGLNYSTTMIIAVVSALTTMVLGGIFACGSN